MPNATQLPSAVDPFATVHALVAQHVARMSVVATDTPVEQLERELLVDAREYARRLLQAHLDLRAQRERAAATPPAELDATATFRPLARSLRTPFGDVTVRRLGWRDTRHITILPADQGLNLPPERYSLTVRRMTAEFAATQSFDTTCRTLGALGIAMPKRQAEQLVVRMAQDFEEFYLWNQAPQNEPRAEDATLLVLTCDAKGIRMIPTALREATRKAAAQDADRPRGDPMAARKERSHDRRMAVVTAVYDQEAHRREAAAIIDNLRPPAQRTLPPEASAMPRPTHKRVWATLGVGLSEAVSRLFDEAERRDPEHRRRWVVLIDGQGSQHRAIEEEAARRGVRVTIVMDLLHVLHYLWLAAMAIHRGSEGAAEIWVRREVERVLTRPMVDVAAGIRQSATLHGVRGAARAPVETCAEYLRDHARFLDYARALADGLPIATGVIEGACRHLVQDRMAITGACWDLPTAEAVLRIRALVASGHWDHYVRFHEQRENLRNHSTPFAEAA